MDANKQLSSIYCLSLECYGGTARNMCIVIGQRREGLESESKDPVMLQEPNDWLQLNL